MCTLKCSPLGKSQLCLFVPHSYMVENVNSSCLDPVVKSKKDTWAVSEKDKVTTKNNKLQF